MERSQTVARVIRSAEGTYVIGSRSEPFLRQVTVTYKNRKLPINDHDDSLPTLSGYYYRQVETSEFKRYAFKTVVVKRGVARFTTRAMNGLHFVFRGTWGTEFNEDANIYNVPFMKGTLFTYKKGKLVKRERIKFGHTVNA
ncbi:MAG: hypothetical protein JNL64_08565 [Blastocatellia bacterium]|nr:hypothetical protein [Blastocatellia bacterium]